MIQVAILREATVLLVTLQPLWVVQRSRDLNLNVPERGLDYSVRAREWFEAIPERWPCTCSSNTDGVTPLSRRARSITLIGKLGRIALQVAAIQCLVMLLMELSMLLQSQTDTDGSKCRPVMS